MIALLRIVALLALHLLVLGCHLDKGTTVLSQSADLQLTSGQPLIHCLSYDPSTLTLLQQGRLRLALSFNRYQPPEKSGIGFKIFIHNKKTKKLLSHFSIYPDLAFSDENGKKSQNFQFSLESNAQSLGAKQTCFELHFATEQVNLKGGTANVQFGFRAIDNQ